jgi:hypothetical protein
MPDLAFIIWCIPGALLLVAVLLMRRSNKPKEDGTVCPVCHEHFYTKHVVDNVVMLPCGHRFARDPSLSASTGPR